MQIKAESLVEMLKKMDEVEEKAGAAFGSSSEEDLQAALEKMRELKAMLYSALAREDPPVVITPPVVAPLPWWQQDIVTYGSSSKSTTEAI